MVISVCMASDKNYGVPIAVLIYSIIVNSKPEDEFSFYILDGGIGDDIKELVEGYKNIKDFSITYTAMGDKFKGHKHFLAHLTIAAFYRLLIPNLFMDIEKMLYLDVDTLVLDSLAPLWNEDITDYYLAGAAGLYPRFDMREGNTYINSGVMLMNLKMWRDEDVATLLSDYITNVRSSDQDAVNAVLQDKTKILDNKWNYPPHKPYFKKNKTQKMDISDKVILHYIDHLKPHAYLRSSKIYANTMRLYWQYMEKALPKEKYAEMRKQAIKNMINRRINKLKEAFGFGKK